MLSRRFRAVVPARRECLPDWASTRILLRRAPRVLFAFEERTRTSRSLQRAAVLARAFDSELHAMFVSPLGAYGEAGDLECSGDRVKSADRGADRVRAWLAAQLGPGGEPAALCTYHGDFTEQVAAHVDAIDASMVIIPSLRVSGEEVSALAHAARVPVLVVRDRAAGDTIVAATDLEDASYPVLRAATHLSRKLGVPLIALHNLSPIRVLNAMDMVLSEPYGPAHTLLELERMLLRRAVRDLSSSATPLVAEEVDPVEAILREARGGGVDLVAVGARPETWWGRWLRRSVTVQIVERAPCSVLVVPIRDPETASEGLVWTTARS
jgi:nucleotide-binding universal stress UspA family protein